jgi:hypothetical protein
MCTKFSFSVEHQMLYKKLTFQDLQKFVFQLLKIKKAKLATKFCNCKPLISQSCRGFGTWYISLQPRSIICFLLLQYDEAKSYAPFELLTI